MAITSVSRWQGIPDNTGLITKIASVMKGHGALSVRCGICHSGAYAGQTYAFVTFPDWSTYGQAMQSLMADEAYSRLLADLSEAAELQERFVVSTEEH